MDASVIIPTYNRSRSLLDALESLNALDYPKKDFEVIIVDSSSQGDLSETLQRFRLLGMSLVYVKENRLSFTLARHAGAEAARTDLLCYIDDDAQVSRGWLKAVVQLFATDSRIGMAGGRIEPRFETTPPAWALKVQKRFNAWSLWHYAEVVCESPGACGPNLAVRKSVLRQVGGFPPDTIGGESDQGETIEKILIGPGDWGLGLAVKKAGYKIMYSPDALVFHEVPALRLSEGWFRKRFEGEGYMRAFTSQIWTPASSFRLVLKSAFSLGLAAAAFLAFAGLYFLRNEWRYLFRFTAYYMLAKFRVERALANKPALANEVWDMAARGIDIKDMERLRQLLP